MLHEIDNAAEKLRDRDAGWVTRRDGADFLGKVAAKALALLNEFRDEMDTDVRRAVDAALGEASGALAGVEPRPAEKRFSLDELVQACSKPNERIVKVVGDGYEVEVVLKNGRKQIVYVENDERKDGTTIVRVYTRCGPPREDAYLWALRQNSKLVHSALALEKTENGRGFILVKCFLEGDITPREMRSSVKEIAYYGDWVESKMTGLDEL